MKILIYAAGALAAVTIIAAIAAPAHAQSAAEINRLNAAMQICNSPAGATMAECAKLRGAAAGAGIPGAGGGIGGLLGKVGGGKASGMAGLLGSAVGAVSAPKATPPSANRNAEIQQAIAICMQSAGTNQAAIQSCLAIASAGGPAPAYAPSVTRSTDPTMAIYNNAADYQTCVAANPNNWQACQSALAAKSMPQIR